MAERDMLAMWSATEKVGGAVEVAAPDDFDFAVADLAAALTVADAPCFCFFFAGICEIQTP